MIGRVDIGEEASIEDSTIHGPVVIGRRSVIRNCHVGPYTAIGNSSVLQGVAVERSVIMENCCLSGVFSLKDSVIGKYARIEGTSDGHQAMSVFLSDDSHVRMQKQVADEVSHGVD